MNTYYPNTKFTFIDETCIIGYVDEFPVFYCKTNQIVKCKRQCVNAMFLIKAFKSSKDIEFLKEDMQLSKSNNFFTIGCLTLSKDDVNVLIKSIKLCQKVKV